MLDLNMTRADNFRKRKFMALARTEFKLNIERDQETRKMYLTGKGLIAEKMGKGESEDALRLMTEIVNCRLQQFFVFCTISIVSHE